MTDMLVRLYDLPPLPDALDGGGIFVRRSLAPEKPLVLAWIAAEFPRWHAEAEVAYARLPIGCFVAVRDNMVLGFACNHALARNFFGPTGVAATERGRGIGRRLLLAALHAQRAEGYAYAIIGGIGPEAFYAKTVGAVTIAGSSPGPYAGLLRPAGHD